MLVGNESALRQGVRKVKLVPLGRFKLRADSAWESLWQSRPGCKAACRGRSQLVGLFPAVRASMGTEEPLSPGGMAQRAALPGLACLRQLPGGSHLRAGSVRE